MNLEAAQGSQDFYPEPPKNSEHVCHICRFEGRSRREESCRAKKRGIREWAFQQEGQGSGEKWPCSEIKAAVEGAWWCGGGHQRAIGRYAWFNQVIHMREKNAFQVLSFWKDLPRWNCCPALVYKGVCQAYLAARSCNSGLIAGQTP